MKDLTKEQTQAIRCALADLEGSKQAFEQGDMHLHDWKSHQCSIDELKEAFPLLKEKKQ